MTALSRFGDGRARLRAGQAHARRSRGAYGDAAGGDERRPRRLPRFRCRRSATRRSSSSSATSRSRTERRSSTCGSSSARRNGAEVVTVGPAGDVQAGAGRRSRCAARRDRAKRARFAPSDRAILIWSGAGGHGGVTLAALANELGLAGEGRLGRLPPALGAERDAASPTRGPAPRTRRLRTRSRSSS